MATGRAAALAKQQPVERLLAEGLLQAKRLLLLAERMLAEKLLRLLAERLLAKRQPWPGGC